MPVETERVKKPPQVSALVTSRECREQAARFAARGLEGGISIRRATILMAIADSWTRLAGQIDRLKTLEAEEKP
jgi:hypothetical protein